MNRVGIEALPKVLKDLWQHKGFSFGIMSDKPGQEWNEFVHKQDELVCLISGEITIIVNDVVLKAEVGQEVFIPAGSVHSVITPSDTSSVWAYGYRKESK